MSSPTALQWLSLMGILWLQSFNGTNSNFPAYSSQLKNLLSISQLQLNNLAFASDAGKLFGFLSGLAAIYLPLWLVLFIGSSLGFVGYGLQYLFLANRIACFSYLQIFFLTVLAGNSICWINTVCYIAAIRNFPADRQVVVGLTTSYLGLSAKIYTDVVNAMFASSPSKRAKAYLLLNSVLPLMTSAITAPIFRDANIVNVGKTSTSGSKKLGFVLMFVITITTGVYAVISSLVPIGVTINVIGVALLLLAPLLTPLGVKIKQVMDERFWLNKDQQRVYAEDSAIDLEKGENGAVTKEEEEEDEINQGFGTKEEIGAKEMLTRADFWLYVFVYLFGATLGLVFLNNLGQIVESRGSPATSSLVSLSASFGFFGRLLPSIMDYYLSRTKYRISRPASIAASMAPMAGAFFLLLSKANISLYISTAVIGVCTGVITSLSVSTTTELFGNKNFGVNHNLVVANIPIGSLLFGYLAAYFYRKEADGLSGKCLGMQCYNSTFVIWGSLCTFGTLLALILYTRTRKFYSQSLNQ